MRILTLMLVLSLPIVSACTSSSNVVTPPPTDADLHYDGDNAAAPSLAAATYEAAARFTTVQTAALATGELTKVNFFISSLPANCKVKVYGAGTASAPGPLLYSHDVTADLVATWNLHVLTSPVPIPNGDLWIAIEFTTAASQATIGCDPGPGVPDGDWLFASTDSSWIPYHLRPLGADINWNIRGVVTVPG